MQKVNGKSIEKPEQAFDVANPSEPHRPSWWSSCATGKPQRITHRHQRRLARRGTSACAWAMGALTGAFFFAAALLA